MFVDQLKRSINESKEDHTQPAKWLICIDTSRNYTLWYFWKKLDLHSNQRKVHVQGVWLSPDCLKNIGSWA